MRPPRRQRAARHAAIRGALALRAPALALLAGRAPDAAGRAALGASPAAWQLFLMAECCALPLARALRGTGVADAVTSEARAIVAAAEWRELQRVLAARAQLAELDALALAFGVAPIVLKGGATVADGTPIDLGDLDLLVTDDVAQVLAFALGCRGYAATGDALARPGGLPIELHDRVPYGRIDVAGAQVADGEPTDVPAAYAPYVDAPPVVPLAGCRALRRLVGASGVMLVLRHVVLHHPFRRGHLRDLVVIAEAIRRCAPAEVEAVARACAADPCAPELTDTLALARAIGAGNTADDGPVVDSPAVRRMVAHKYLFALGTWRRAVRVAPRWPTLLCAALDRPAVRRAPLWDALSNRAQTDPHWALPALARHAPRLAAGVRGAVRVPYRTALVLCALGAGPFARRRVERLVA